MSKSLCAQAMIFHVTLQILQISFFTQCRISKAKRNPNASKLYFVQTIALFPSAQCHENKRWQLPFFWDKDQDGSVTRPRCGAALLLSAQSDGKFFQRLTADTKQSGWCHRRDGWFPAERPWLLWIPSWGSGSPQYMLRDPGHSLFHTLPFSAMKGIRKSVLCTVADLSPWNLFCRRDGMPGVLHYLLRWAEQGPPPGESVSRDCWAGIVTTSISLCKLSELIKKSYPNVKTSFG